MEAMVLGFLPISTDCPCGGPRTLIDDNTNGILVKMNDVYGFSNTMRRILSEPLFASTLSKKAKIKAREFDFHKVFEEWENHILSINDK